MNNHLQINKFDRKKQILQMIKFERKKIIW